MVCLFSVNTEGVTRLAVVNRQKIRENAESAIFLAILAKSGNSDAKDRRAIRNSLSTNQKTGAQPGALSQPIRSQQLNKPLPTGF